MTNHFKYPDNQIRFEDRQKEMVLKAVRPNSYSFQKKERISRKKKWAYAGIAAAALFILFIGTAYFSPGMAKVAAKIPYFSVFIKQEEYKNALYDVISDTANKHRYDLRRMDASIPDKELTVWLGGTKEDVNSIKGDVKKTFSHSLKDHNFGAYDIRIKRDKHDNTIPEETPEMKKQQADSLELEQKIIKALEANNYTMAFPVQARINEIEKYIFVAIPKTEKRTDELNSLLNSISSEYGKGFKFDIRQIDMEAREQEQRWDEAGVIHVIASGLMENKEFKVKGFSYSFHPLPLQIKVKTSVKADDPDAKVLAERIEEEIKSFLQTHEKAEDIRNDPYELTILSKDKKKIN
ncbi:DUF4030 domain-containing protein [Cytobacillus firmus]|uniref:DUF4030 domain-containing protein n=1 Tax=Cytobacillus firmus TaxID=1399 RepID=UPI0020303635|nr:DUF4030 domain-containing protein [Cytobacillus firmus]URT71753.1 DUF4030 domain-containing protein [Cytobacillus firmus]